MKRRTILLPIVLLIQSSVFAQCLTIPTFPSCTGTETQVTAGDEILVGQTKYFYGAPADLANVKMSGGTLVVCKDLILTEIVYDSGVIYVRPNATLIINNVSGLIVRGNTQVYNAGTFQVWGNYVMDGTWASATKPNLFVNALSSSKFYMPNQYFVINNPHSRLVNNGIADFHGIITEAASMPGSVCLGFNSQTRMRVLYNYRKNAYVSPEGPACVYVQTYSRFEDTLTNYPSINVCLGTGHTSDATCVFWGCKPNAWGKAQVTTACANCASVLTFLSLNFLSFTAKALDTENLLRWEMNAGVDSKFIIERMNNNGKFIAIDSVRGDGGTKYEYKDKLPSLIGQYRIVYKQGVQQVASQIVVVKRKAAEPYPNPFSNEITIPLLTDHRPIVSITDGMGRNIKNYICINQGRDLHILFEKLHSGLYMITLTEGTLVRSFKVRKQ